MLRCLSKPAPLRENIVQHQDVVRCPGPTILQRTQADKCSDDGQPISFIQNTSGTKEKSNQNAAHFLTVTNAYTTKECSPSSQLDPHMRAEVLLMGEKEENL